MVSFVKNSDYLSHANTIIIDKLMNNKGTEYYPVRFLYHTIYVDVQYHVQFLILH